MNDLSPKERLSLVIKRKTVDRPPVICPGGMMNSAITDIMNMTGNALPSGHRDPLLMASIASDIAEHSGFENIGVPFCMTVEAEVMGSGVDFGTLSCEPKISKEIYPSVKEVKFRDIDGMLSDGRVGLVCDAVSNLSRRYGDLPVIASITGPVSTAASVIDPMTFLKDLRRDRDNAHRFMDHVSDFLIAYARRLAENGASAVAISDPTATGEILGPKFFEEYAVRYINRIADAVKETGVPVIVHICGQLDAVKPLIPGIRAGAISTDALVNLEKLKMEYPSIVTMGNLSTYLLESGTPEKIKSNTERLVASGIDIIAPACGLSTSSPLANIQAFTSSVREYHA